MVRTMARVAQEKHRMARQRFVAAAALLDEAARCPGQERARELVALAQRHGLVGVYELEPDKQIPAELRGAAA